jgi:hypothetical protein
MSYLPNGYIGGRESPGAGAVVVTGLKSYYSH